MNPHALYRFFSPTGDLLYIGRTSNPGSRWGDHSKEKPWWIEVATVQVEPFPDLESVKIAERHAIETEHPKYNIQYAQTQEFVPVLPTPDDEIKLLGGEFAAIAQRTGHCYLGTITTFSFEADTITINPYNAHLHAFGDIEVKIDLNDIVKVVYTDVLNGLGKVHAGQAQVVYNSSGLGYDVFYVAPLARFQAQWEFRHGLIDANQFREVYAIYEGVLAS